MSTYQVAGFEVYIYLAFIALSFLYKMYKQHFGKVEEQPIKEFIPQNETPNKEPSTNPTFDDFLKQFKQEKEIDDEDEVEEIPQNSPPRRTTIFEAAREKHSEILIDKKLDQNKGNIYQTIQQLQTVPSNTPSVTNQERLVPYFQETVVEPHSVVKMLKNPRSLSDAVILAEVLKTKF